MQDLQGDLAALGVHRVGDQAMLAHLPREAQLRAGVIDAAGEIGGEAAGHDEADAAAGALGVERRHALEAVLLLLKAGMHRTHQRAVAQRREAQVERGEQVRIRGLGGGLVHVLISGMAD